MVREFGREEEGEMPSREALGLLGERSNGDREKTVSPPSPEVLPLEKAGKAPLTLLPVDENEMEVTAGSTSALSAVLTSRLPEKERVRLTAEISYTFTYPGEGAEWRVWWILAGAKRKELHSRTSEVELNLQPNVPLPLTLEVEVPVGVRYKDRVEVRLTGLDLKGEGKRVTLALSWVSRQALLAIKTFRGYEREVADTIRAKAEENPGMIFSLLVPSAIRGYVFAEGMSFDGVNDMLKGIRKARGLVKGETTLKEVESLLAPKVTVEGFVEGAIVELVSGPFKGEKARVKRINQDKEQITVELIEAVVPIPVTVRGDHVRMVEKSGG